MDGYCKAWLLYLFLGCITLPLFFRFNSSISACNPCKVSWCSFLTKVNFRLSSKIFACGSRTGDSDKFEFTASLVIDPSPVERVRARLELFRCEDWEGLEVDIRSISTFLSWKIKKERRWNYNFFGNLLNHFWGLLKEGRKLCRAERYVGMLSYISLWT